MDADGDLGCPHLNKVLLFLPLLYIGILLFIALSHMGVFCVSGLSTADSCGNTTRGT